MTTITSSDLRATARNPETQAREVLSALLQRIGSLLRMADGLARTDPEQAARLRAAARRNWYGDV